ncbi:MAG: hypothetical protein J6S61_03545 [Elusimicrobiaceae bacterium]|nr:hypothetical protein [Elusimicrobiaceae bacterium]
MKKLLCNLGKYFCLMLGIFLFISSVPAFGQEIEQFLSPASIGKMRKARTSFNEVVDNMQSAILEVNEKKDPKYLEIHVREDFPDMLSDYETLIKEEDHILSYTISLNVADREAMDILAYNKYLAEDSRQALEALRLQDKIIFNKLNSLIEFFLNEYAFVYVGDLASLIGADKAVEFENCLKYFENRFDKNFYNGLKQNIELYNKEIYPKMTDLFRQAVKPGDVLETAFKQMPQEQKAALKLGFQARDAEILTEEMAGNMMAYIQEFGKGLTDPKYYSKEGLIVDLNGMSLAERSKYADEITGLNRGSKNFIADYEKRLNTVEKRVVRKSITKGFWVLAGLGAIATAAYITDVAADNHFNAGRTMSNRELATIGKKIEHGTANVKERFAFFTNPATKRYVQEDPVYTLNLVDLVEGVYAANELLNTQKAQGKQIKDNVENGVLKNLNKQMSTTDFGVGSL